MREDYFKTVKSKNPEDRFKSVDEVMDIGQMFAEELGNYFDETNKTQAESLLMMFNEIYRLGREDSIKYAKLDDNTAYMIGVDVGDMSRDAAVNTLKDVRDQVEAYNPQHIENYIYYPIRQDKRGITVETIDELREKLAEKK